MKEHVAINGTKKFWKDIEVFLNNNSIRDMRYGYDMENITDVKKILYPYPEQHYSEQPTHLCFLCEYSKQHGTEPFLDFPADCRHCPFFKKYGRTCVALGYNEGRFNEQAVAELLFFCELIEKL